MSSNLTRAEKIEELRNNPEVSFMTSEGHCCESVCDKCYVDPSDSHTYLQVEQGTWFEVETNQGYELVPADLIHGYNAHKDEIPLCVFEDYCEGTPKSFKAIDGYCARYSAPGYMDCTDWVGPYPTQAEAETDCKNMYGNDE